MKADVKAASIVWIARNPIRIYMRKTKVNVTTVAAVLATARTLIYSWLSGKTIPSARLLAAMEEYDIATTKAYAEWWDKNPNPPINKRSKSAIDKERVRALLDEKSEIDPATGCKVYCGTWNNKDIALIRIGRRNYTVQVAALWVAGKMELYEKAYVYRTCNTPACCNVEHIRKSGHMGQGMNEMRALGIVKSGPRGIYLTKSRRECVKTLLREGRTPEFIAEDTGVNVNLIRHIKNEMEAQEEQP
jgi:hypothetical protein